VARIVAAVEKTIMECPQREIGVAIGDILLGKYRVERVLGAGGMGAVVAARHMRLDQPVAIKVLLPGVVEDGEIVARFEREARASARMKGDHIARVTDVGTLESGAPTWSWSTSKARTSTCCFDERARYPSTRR
jgi:serine/threonine protein kinase